MDEIHHGTNSRTNNNKDVFNFFTIIWIFKLTLMLTLLYFINSTVNAYITPNDTEFCKWVESVAITVSQNRLNGIDENTLIVKVLETNTDYYQQAVIIPIIGRIYNESSNLSPEEHALIELRTCLYSAASFNDN